MYNIPENLPEPKVYRLYNGCFGDKPLIVQQLINNPIESIFNDNYVVIQTNCPLFNWIAYNKKSFYSLIQLGLLDHSKYESSHPAIHGFRVLSNVMKSHIVFNKELLNAVNDRMLGIGNSKCISFHIRMGNYKSDFRDGRVFLYGKDIYSFIDCPIVQKYSKAFIFLSSDSIYAKNIIMNNTRKHSVVSSPKKATHSSHISFLDNFKGTYDTFLDLVTLSTCNELIGTSGSTFTVLAASLMGKLPYLIGQNSTCELPRGYSYY